MSNHALAWQTEIDGTASGSDRVFSVAVDGGGDVIAGGFVSNSGTGPDFAVVKLDGASGTELWRTEINGTANSTDEVRSVAVDAGGDVIAGGLVSNSGTFSDFLVVKFDGASGVELWQTEIDGTASGSDRVFSVAVDGGGDVIAGGFVSNSGTGPDFAVVKLDGASGTELWGTEINGTRNASDLVFSVAVDGDGNVIAGGSIQNSGTGLDFAVVKLAGATGAELWRTEINGTANSTDEVLSLAVDAGGDVIAGGSVSNSGTFSDFAVVKLDGATGAELWRTEINGTANSIDFVLSLAVDAGGDVIAGGFILNSGTGLDFAVVKRDGVNGGVLWRTEINATANSSDLVFSVAVDAGGDVIAGGRITNAKTGGDFAVVKLAGADGSELIGTPIFLLSALVNTVVALELQTGIENALDAQLDAVENALDDVNANNDVAAINALEAFINAVEAQSGGFLTEEEANTLIDAALLIIDLLTSA